MEQEIQKAQVSVVVPVLNEEEALSLLLGDLAAQKNVSLQVIAADGGSADRGREAFEGSAICDRLWIDAPRGRGAQMNAGANAARFEDLLFLHADARLKDENLLSLGFEAMRRECGGSDRVLGHFAAVFHDRPPDFLHFFLAAKTALDLPECVNGDQGFWVKKRFFHELGGFDESLPFLEDMRFSRLAAKTGRIALLPGIMETSSRRFQAEGTGKRLILNAMIRFAHDAGVGGFYSKAGAIYGEQKKAGKLRLLPYFRELWGEGKRSGRFRFIGSLRRFGGSNAWHVPFWLRCRREFRKGKPFPGRVDVAPAGPILRAVSGCFVVTFFFAGLLAAKIFR